MTFLPAENEHPIDESSGVKTTDLHAIPAAVADRAVRPLDGPALVTPFVSVQKVAAAVVTTETDSLGDSSIIHPSKRTRHEALAAGMGENGLRRGP